VEASSTPTICRLPDSRRHQLSAIALCRTAKPVRAIRGPKTAVQQMPTGHCRFDPEISRGASPPAETDCVRYTLLGGGGALMTGEDAIWHVVIGGEQHGPLSRSQVLEYLHDERLLGSDLIWRPGFSDWKSISEVTDFWQPPRRGSPRPPPMPAPTEQPERDNNQINAVATNKKWSIWRAANAGLLVAVLPLALQIANGRGGSNSHRTLRQQPPRPSCI
jgi:GYF domain 2